MPKIPRIWLYTLVLGGVVYAGVVLTEPDQPAKKSASRGKTVASTQPDGQLKADLAANFGPITDKPKNAFRPLIARLASGPAGKGVFGENLVPPSFANGEGNWAYTGTAEINGKKNVLLENTTTGDGVFLNVGERWKTCRVTSASSESVMLTSDDGETRELKLAAPVEPEPAPGLQPVQPGAPLQGAIGALTVVPEAQSNGNGGRRRGRRGGGNATSSGQPAAAAPAAVVDAAPAPAGD
ncbi:MAG: hypothetical protein HYR64_06230 [Fimbriimonas ginsengisoli]|uniref:Uncharacterized protein n=1 Tax=Fimbriimonas ginsengisoli TaxID=1005039 RepID=A0A931PTT0_FIMGI|nr:hypothetical protein [Fimbriimonas ginsengisoli]